MPENAKEKTNLSRRSKALFAFATTVCFMGLFLLFTFSLTSKRNIPNTEKYQFDIALRGAIITQDNFTIASSKEIYRAEIDLRSVNTDKLDLFLKLFQIYSGSSDEEMKDIKKRLDLALKKKNYNFILAQDLDSKHANYLKELSKKLYVQGFFKSFTNSNNKAETRGLSIIEHKEDRTYMGRDSLTPVVGYTLLVLDKNDGILKNLGMKGLEKSYNECLLGVQNEKVQGLKDVGGNIILNLDSLEQRKINGCNLHISINLKLQKSIEKMIDSKNADLNASEIIVGVMESKTGRILALASSRRYDPQNRSKDLSVLNASAIEYGYEAGSVIKPFIFTTALSLGKLNLNEQINTHGGYYKLGRFTIQDDHKAKAMSPSEILIYSSNIGMIQIAKRLSNFEIVAGLKIFHFGEKSGVDLPYEQKGELPNTTRLREVEKSVLSYGYGLKTTFMQLLAAYNVFNNDGVYITPHFGEKFIQDGKTYKLEKEFKSEKILASNTAKQIKNILVATTERRKIDIEGIEIGGKTGTARIAEKGGYGSSRYNASFFGFANDADNAYTIGVLVRNPRKAYSYYAAQSALPLFRQSIDMLIQEDFLKPTRRVE